MLEFAALWFVGGLLLFLGVYLGYKVAKEDSHYEYKYYDDGKFTPLLDTLERYYPVQYMNYVHFQDLLTDDPSSTEFLNELNYIKKQITDKLYIEYDRKYDKNLFASLKDCYDGPAKYHP